MSRIWFVTGISSGLGNAISRVVMERGDFLIGTFRSTHQVDTFNRQHEASGFSVKLDVTHEAEIHEAFEVVLKRFGKIDVLVNNAGFGFAGSIEETSMEEARDVMETNFFGSLRMSQMALPIMRNQRSGHIIQISSHGGIKAVPGFGIYNASKFALEGFSEALAGEVAPMGVKVVIVEPGPFRTGFAGDSLKEAVAMIDAYKETAGSFREKIRQVHGKQEGDPYKAAQAIYEISRLETPPLRLPLGKVAVASVIAKLTHVRRDLDNWKTVAEEAVF